MEEIEKAIKDKGEWTQIELNIIPNSKTSEIAGFDPWRKRINMKIAAPPLDNRANKEIIVYLSELFKVTSKDIKIIAGNKSSKKTIEVRLGFSEVKQELSG